MTRKEKYLLALLIVIVIALFVMIFSIFLDRGGLAPKLTPETTETEQEEDLIYEGPEIPEVTSGDSIEDIEADIDMFESYDFGDMETEIERLEREIEEF
ncbi:MAG: hypothetical protein PHH17_01615 [Candidatus Pacebacteria bacterium]|jgi:hypothetical protein|nr:hypothetical protein [Candidatus Paceibacterota bacterium]MDD3072383.1 hypothetical protein [Candidatus Paceibacterota bacterium]MDD3728996.1 hypothetical protein [Candidatus Paceibacterota bacterium]MDD4201633.1 hypothetical protein [Candidatus Paceibacterota bacterium]MDD4467230.1 hypothetical protein [Candidatus Paceibacterota bacterium]